MSEVLMTKFPYINHSVKLRPPVCSGVISEMCEVISTHAQISLLVSNIASFIKQLYEFQDQWK